MSLHIVILAAGQGQRMNSKLPKVLHRFAGTPIIERIIQTVEKLAPEAIHIIYGHGGDLLPKTLSSYPVHWHRQDHQLGTAHALAQALPSIPDAAKVLVLVGDIPLISEKMLRDLTQAPEANALSLVTASFKNPTGLGRILRNTQGDLVCIVEEKDATEEQKFVQEINTGIMLSTAALFKNIIPQLNNHNVQGEYYLTDVINLLVQNKQPIYTSYATIPEEVMGVNDRVQLERLERYYYQTIAQSFMRQGVTIADSTRFDVRGEATIGCDTFVDANVLFEGKVTIGTDCEIGPFVKLRNVTMGNHVKLEGHCVIKDATIADDCIIGPFAHIRPGTTLAEGSHVGNFVEIKNADIGQGSKINHLSYIGDTTMGAEVNVGAGTITCNYDGKNKHRTVIHDYVFIGSGTQLVAPIIIKQGSTIGAGSTITRDTPEDTLTLSRAKQISVPGWQRPKKINE
jgi:bifunctional UDP-N-acetylglucosamine pyrophosphorylase/glucosamine-1-phosphate N-acetyltransferase